MRIFRAKNELKTTEFTDAKVVFKGQMFFLDYTDEVNSLPQYSKENWDELEFYNNFGTIILRIRK